MIILQLLFMFILICTYNAMLPIVSINQFNDIIISNAHNFREQCLNGNRHNHTQAFFQVGIYVLGWSMFNFYFLFLFAT